MVRVIPLQHPSEPSGSGSGSVGEAFTKWKAKMMRMDRNEWVQMFLPCYRWVRTYQIAHYLQPDLLAGITVGIMLVPQSMSYAKLAGLQPIYGLYTGFVPVIVYAIFGSSRQLAIGPVALVSLLVSNILGSIVDSSDKLYTELAILLALMVGILQCIMGLLRRLGEITVTPHLERLMNIVRDNGRCPTAIFPSNTYSKAVIIVLSDLGKLYGTQLYSHWIIIFNLQLGWILRFISHSVISGFTTASAVVIGMSQAKDFLGYDIERSSLIIPLIKSVFSGMDKFKWPPFVMGSATLAVLLIMKHLGKSRKCFRFLRAAGPLTAVVLSSAFVKIVCPSSISLVGNIPQGLPIFSAPQAYGHVKSLIPTSLLITGVAVLESVGIAKALAAKNGYELDSNQELFGLGVSNIAGSFFSAYPATGSFSRSAVNHEAGAKTGLSGIIMFIIMSCSLQFLTPLFELIPQCALAAIVISAVIGLVDYEEAIFLWHVDKRDFLLWTITCAATLFLGIEIGVLVGVGVSLAFVIHESANPHMAILGRLPGTTVYRNVQQYPEAHKYNGIVVVRFDAPIYFANISYIKDRLREYETEIDLSKQRGPEVTRIHFVIIEMAPVTYVDSSAVQALKELYQEYKSRDVQMAISNPNQEVLLTLARSGVVDLIGKEWYFVRVHDAVQVCLQYVKSRNESPKPLQDNKPKKFQRVLRQRTEESATADEETGGGQSFISTNTNSNLEPLLLNRS